MNLNDTSELFNKLQSQTDDKLEKEIYKSFNQILSSLKMKDLTENQLQLIQEKLSLLNLETKTENRRKYYKQKLSEFKTFLKSDFSFTSKKYYRNLGMSFGIAIGTGIGITTLGIAIGLPVGMLFGIAIGTSKDTKAKKQGRVI